ncbi:unnamed protein product [Sphagnum jensenii]|uniref:WAT1-related protein n=1 Tax=Sphagnum jensenii TaxID=128206 RepID=A0ABP0W0W7_9BRYO
MRRVGSNGECFESSESQWPVHAALLVAQLLSGGYYVIIKMALVNEMNLIVLSVYRDLLALVFLIPAAWLIERQNFFRLSRDVVLWLLVLGLIGIFGSQFLLFKGISLTSTEVSVAMHPLIPVFTAVVAIVFGVEAVWWHRRDGQAKVAGIVICCAGAILMTFYKGPVVLGAKPTSTLEAASTSMIKEPVHLPGSGIPHTTIDGWQIGVLCLIGNCLCMGTNINLQVPVLRRFPAPVSLIAYSYAFGTVFMGIAAIFLVNDTSAWALSWDMDLVAILYNGIISSALNLAIMTWALSKVGPLFVASYIPLQTVSATVLALIFLKSSVYLGSILGTLMIILGLLSVSWAHQESARYRSLSEVIGRSVHSHDHQLAGTHGLDYRTPLLQGYP